MLFRYIIDKGIILQHQNQDFHAAGQILRGDRAQDRAFDDVCADDGGLVHILNHFFDEFVLYSFVLIHIIEIGGRVLHIVRSAVIPYFQHISVSLTLLKRWFFFLYYKR